MLCIVARLSGDGTRAIQLKTNNSNKNKKNLSLQGFQDYYLYEVLTTLSSIIICLAGLFSIDVTLYYNSVKA